MSHLVPRSGQSATCDPAITKAAVNAGGSRNIFTNEEIGLLGQIVSNGAVDRLSLILCKGNSADIRQKRISAWNKIAEEFNDQAAELPTGYSGHRRTGEQLKRKFQATRSKAKADAVAGKSSMSTTGGGRLGVEKSLNVYAMNFSQEELYGVGDDIFGTVTASASDGLGAAPHNPSAGTHPDATIDLQGTQDDELDASVEETDAGNTYQCTSSSQHSPSVSPPTCPSATPQMKRMVKDGSTGSQGNGFALKRARQVNSSSSRTTPQPKKQAVKSTEQSLMAAELELIDLRKTKMRLQANAQRRREHRLHLSPRALADPDFLAQFRLAPMAVEELIMEIGGTLEEALTPRNRRGNRGRPIPLSTVVCIGLKYLGHNTTFRDLAIQFGTSLGTVQRCIDGFVFAVIGICTPREVVFPPPNTADVMQAFKARRGIPHIVGAVDGCHVRLAGRPPGVVNADAFYCRKGFFSLNCLFIVSPDLTISYAFSRYGGSSHDSFILRRSHLWDQLNRVDGLLPNRGGFPAKLLGDAGYPLMPNLLTPYSRGAGGAVDEDVVRTFNTCHSSTRFFCEQSFGVLKSRFRCLHTGLRVDIDQASRVIAASVTLHNMARRRHWRSFQEEDYIDPTIRRAIREENDGDDGLAMGNGRNALPGFNDVEQMVLAEDPATLRNVRTSAAMKALAKRRRDQLAALLALVRVAGVDQ